jgi:ribosome-binding factor A
MSANSTDESKECNEALNKAAGFLRSQLSRESSMRMVPQLRFYFDSSVGRGRDMEDLIRKAADSDREMGLRDDSAEEQ